MFIDTYISGGLATSDASSLDLLSPSRNEVYMETWWYLGLLQPGDEVYWQRWELL